jgi:hypothetical protein
MKLERWDNQETIVNDDECKSMRKLLEKYKGTISFAYSNLSYSNLSYSNLSYSDLRGSDLSNSDLTNCKLPSPTMVLLANWQNVSNSLCLALMRYDAWNHTQPKKFLIWKETNTCPYYDMNFQRSANFQENSALITKRFLSLKVQSAVTLMNRLIKEKCKIKE